jgi:pyruvate,water dikinase
MPTLTEPVVRVLRGTCGDSALLGGKGAALDRLIAWGLPVPATAVVTADLSRSLAEQPHLRDLITRLEAGDAVTAGEVDELVAAAAIDPLTIDSIRTAASALVAGRPGGRLAVRSSATAEDLREHSFAGQYRTLLEIDPADDGALLGAVRAVLASLWYPAPVAYRAAAGMAQQSTAMAVVLMEMVAASHAGVVFTVDPVGDGSTARLEVVDGLGESLVSGQRTPDVHVVPRDHTSATSAAGLDPQLARALELAMLIEARSGTPQDVEFACDDTTVWVVQARPITTTPHPAPATRAPASADDGCDDDGCADDGCDDDGCDDDPALLATLDLTTAGIGEMLPGALPPLRYGVCAHLVEEAFRSTFADLGVMLDRADPAVTLLRRVRGRAAMDFGLLQGWTGQLPGGDVARLEEQYFGSRRPTAATPPMPAHHPARFARLRGEWRSIRSRRRADVDAELSIAAITTLCSEPLAIESLPIDTCTDAALAGYWLRLLDLAVRAMTAELGVAAQAAASYSRLELLLGRRIGVERAAAITAHLATAIDLGRPQSPAVRAASSAAVFAGPTWAELGRRPPDAPTRVSGDPYGELHLLYYTLDPDGGLRASLRLRAASLALEDALEQLARRERAKTALLQLGGEVRRVHLAVGARLAERGLLPSPADVELLSVTEFRVALSGGSVPAPGVLARRRHAADRAERAAPLPARFTGSDPHTAVEAPTGARLDRLDRLDRSAPLARLDGWAVSSGSYTGAAHVVRSPTDEFPEGGVLVADATDPSWSPLFLRAGAIVLERGGPLSHAAILARELGVPAVTNVASATRRLGGCMVAVDGDRGVVVVVSEELES